MLGRLVLGWLAALVLGRVPRFLHRFMAAFVRTLHAAWRSSASSAGRSRASSGARAATRSTCTIAPPARQRRLGRPRAARPGGPCAAPRAGVRRGGARRRVSSAGSPRSRSGGYPAACATSASAALRYQARAPRTSFSSRLATRLRACAPAASVRPGPGAARPVGGGVQDAAGSPSSRRSWWAGSGSRGSLVGHGRPGRAHAPHVDVDAVFGRGARRPRRAVRALPLRRLGASDRGDARDARGLRALRRPLRARVGGRADRHRDAARDARARDPAG